LTDATTGLLHHWPVAALGVERSKIHIIGPSGAGKSTLAADLGARLHLPVHPLDPIAFLDTRWSIRPLPEKVEAIEKILQQPGWITEGGHLRWTEPLLEAADIIVWLDVPLLTTLKRRAAALRGQPFPFQIDQIWWQIRWYFRPYRRGQDLDRMPSRAAIRHFLKRRIAKVRRYRRNPRLSEVEAIVPRLDQG
jgi:hypothetical protein